MKTSLRICGFWLLTLLMLAGPGAGTALHAQIISVFAGGGSTAYASFTGSTAATSAKISLPSGVAEDAAGNVYFTGYSDHVVYKVNSSGIISRIAGGGITIYPAFTGSTAATSANIGGPFSLAVDAAGNVYIGDVNNSIVFKVNSSGIISRIAGGGSTTYTSFTGSTAGTSANIGQQFGLAADAAGNVYIGNVNNNAVYKVNSSGIISVFAGGGSTTYSSFTGSTAATSASIGAPYGVAADAAGNVYIGDGSNSLVYKVAAACTAPTTPTVTATASSICSGSGATLTISGTLNGAANWAIYTAGCGTGTPVSNTSGAYSTGALSASTTYYVRGEGGCVTTPGSCGSATVTVNPTPDVAQPGNQVMCSGGATAAVTFSGSVSGTTYNWTNSNTAIGLAASGSGDIGSFTAANTGNAPISATVTVTPVFNNTIVINGTHNGGSSISSRLYQFGNPSSCGSSSFPGTTSASGVYSTYSFTNTSGVSRCVTIRYRANVADRVHITAYNGSFNPSNLSSNYLGDGGSASFGPNGVIKSFSITVGIGQTIVLFSSSAPGSACADFTIWIDGLSDPCTGPSKTFTYTVDPLPAATVSGTAPLCPGGNNGFVTFGTPTAGTSPFTYSVDGTTYNPGSTINNLSAGGYSATLRDANNCTSTAQSVTVPVGTDNTPPVAATQNVTVNLNASGNASITAAQVNNGSTDNCGINTSLTSVTPTTFNCSNVPGVSSAGNAIAFTGGYIDVPDEASLNPQNTWTLETWVKTDPAYSGNQHSLIEKYDNGTMYGYLLRITSGNKLMAGLVTAGSASYGAYVTGSTTLTPGTWYHVAATYNISGQVSLFVNGQADGSVNSSTAGTLYSNPSTVSLKIGARGNDAGTRLHGVMDEVRIWNVEHNQVQIKATMNKSLSGTEAGLVAYYRFEEPSSSTTVIDNTPLTTANTGTLTGSVSRVASGAGVGGTTPVTLSVTDINGNTSTATAFVTVVDNIAPTVVTKSATIYLDANGNAALSPSQVDNGSSDNCSFNLSVTPSSFTCNSLGSFAGTLNGNLTADNYFDAYLSTSDNTLGTSIGSGSNFTVTYALTAATLTPGTNYFLHIKGTDVGGPQSLLGDFTLTGNFEFANGLQTMSTNTANWHVNTTGFGNSYNTPVSYGVNAVSPRGNRSGISSNALNIWDPSGDNYSGATEYAYFSTPIVYNPNKTTVTLTAVDAGNNMTSAPATVSIVDNILPTVTAPANVVVNGYCQNVPASAVTLGNATAHDNCSIASITNNAPASYPVGTTTVRWTAKDGSGNTNYADQSVTVNPATVNANPSVAPLYPMSGQEIQTIYLGYPSTAQSETMSVSPSGGTGPYTFSWTSTGCGNSVNPVSNITTTSTSSSADFTPGAGYICSGNNDNVYSFTVTATDNHGCAVTATKKFNVVNPYVSTGDVQICYKVAVRGGSTTQLLVVSPSQVSTHLAHGDYLGNCAVFTGVRSIPSAEVEEQKVAVYPNPTTGVFILELSSINQEASIMITDVAGKLITQKTIAKGAMPTATFDLGNVARGMYLIQVRDGELNYRTKIVVQ